MLLLRFLFLTHIPCIHKKKIPTTPSSPTPCPVPPTFFFPFFSSERIKPVARQAVRQLPWERLQTELEGGKKKTLGRVGVKDGVQKERERCGDGEGVFFMGGGGSKFTADASVLFVSSG